ncbi:MAG TPA: SDR family oxidoreductase [Dehalococcoidia bacterium]|nr:SDR family oxidoreductase [Dehalococcoidia bacterium]
MKILSLEGKKALVIGASNVIGRAIAVALGEAGADVAVATTTRSKHEETIVNSCSNELWALDRKTFALSIDAADEGAVDDLAQRTIDELGGLSVLVNAQDLPYAQAAGDVDIEDYRRVIDVNLVGPFVACRAASAHMLNTGGSIINVASVLGERGMAHGAGYCSAQAGVLNLTRALALEWAREGIRVNAIGAGWTEGMGILADEASTQQLERYLPYKRLAQPQEIAGIAVYLASDASAYLTGQVVWIDGGALSHV